MYYKLSVFNDDKLMHMTEMLQSRDVMMKSTDVDIKINIQKINICAVSLFDID